MSKKPALVYQKEECKKMTEEQKKRILQALPERVGRALGVSFQIGPQ